MLTQALAAGAEWDVPNSVQSSVICVSLLPCCENGKITWVLRGESQPHSDLAAALV